MLRHNQQFAEISMTYVVFISVFQTPLAAVYVYALSFCKVLRFSEKIFVMRKLIWLWLCHNEFYAREYVVSPLGLNSITCYLLNHSGLIQNNYFNALCKIQFFDDTFFLPLFLFQFVPFFRRNFCLEIPFFRFVIVFFSCILSLSYCIL